MTTITLDVRGLKCPLPVLRTRKALARLRAEDRLEVLCTDPMSAIDIPVLVRSLEMKVSITARADGGLTFLIEKNNSGDD